MKVLITGGAGFIGSHTTDLLLKKGYEVAVIDDLSNGKKENIDKRVPFHRDDITEANLEKIFKAEKPEAIMHLAAQISLRKSIENPSLDAKVNILGTMKVLEAMEAAGTKKIIFSSTAAVYGTPLKIMVDENHPINPESPYGLDKYAAEKFIESFCQERNIDYCILRYANVYGPRQDPLGEAGVISIFTEKLLKNQSPSIFGDGNQTRDFVFVKDVALANLAALESGKNQIYNVGTGNETSVNEIFSLIKKFSGSKSTAIHTDPVKEVKRMAFDCSKIEKDLNWKPQTNIEEGLKETVDYFRKRL
jgi:UDP-glucose 4-epimerase